MPRPAFTSDIDRLARFELEDHPCVMVWCRAAGQWQVHYEQASPVTQ